MEETDRTEDQKEGPRETAAVTAASFWGWSHGRLVHQQNDLRRHVYAIGSETALVVVRVGPINVLP